MSPELRYSAGRVPPDRTSLVAKIARMYHEQGLRQSEIAGRLHISQSRVSRLLQEAVDRRIVRIVVVPPPGVHSALEEAVRDKFGLVDVVVADASSGDEASVIAALGTAGASYLETTLAAKDRVGVSSWSSTLLATANVMSSRTVRTASEVVQVIGGLGHPKVRADATRLIERLAQVTGGTPTFLPAPAIVESRTERDGILQDPTVADVLSRMRNLNVLLAGIETLSTSSLFAASGNAVSKSDRAILKDAGAVGEVCLRFFDANGKPVATELDSRVVGIGVDDLRAVPRKIGIAGGNRKYGAIRAAALGNWIDILITDATLARRLAES